MPAWTRKGRSRLAWSYPKCRDVVSLSMFPLAWWS